MSQINLFGDIESNDPQEIVVKSYIRKKQVKKKKLRTPTKVVSKSPINKDSLTKQSNTLIKYLLDNENATFLDAINLYIMSPHSRFAEISSWMLKNKMILHREMISIKKKDGGLMHCKRYWIDEIDKQTAKILLF